MYENNFASDQNKALALTYARTLFNHFEFSFGKSNVGVRSKKFHGFNMACTHSVGIIGRWALALHTLEEGVFWREMIKLLNLKLKHNQKKTRRFPNTLLVFMHM
ncbi:hypothetical protein [Peribacillus sp. R9-11]|jgi:hypothetical protein|uniref:hypothetical protein n=1 Tax=Peribacillus sp. R9-11 TaxID=3073271 RepID=UPI002868946E|nr:hypothetical protein [Peribacillus sp. R9-11]WMX54959.1 hypothetical protein RE409_23365 [Peribacillus sp. R9-11]